MHIGLNAHLLSAQRGYRSAGIHGYIYNTLVNLHAVAPDDWQFTAMVGANNPHTFDGLTMHKAAWDTESPLRRIAWEQTLQPLQLGKFDLLHSMTFVSPLILTKPSVVTVFDLSFVHYPQVLSPARRLYLRMFTTLSCRRANRVIGISHATAEDVHISLGIPQAKIDVAIAGYDSAAYLPLPPNEVEAFRTKQGLPDRFWLFLGTLEPRKNLVTLLDAYAALPANERLPLILAGGKGWDYEPIFQRVDRYNLSDSVHFPGFVPAEDLPFWYNSAEVFIYPSVFEGFGLPVLEAMACGTPTIVSDASSLPEVVGEHGTKVPPDDVVAWSDTLRRAYRDSEWRTHARDTGLAQATQFSWRITAQQTIDSYQRALSIT